MPSKRKTLAEQLADAANPEPKDYDPEDLEQGAGESDNELDASSDEDRTSHYVDVGRSNLRDDGIALSEGKYKGSQVSRDALDSWSQNEDERNNTESEYESPEEPSNIASGPRSGSENESASDLSGTESSSEMEQDSDSEAEQSRVAKPRKAGSGSGSGISQILSDEQKHLLTRLNSDQESDVAKGKAVSAQIQQYENLLDLRIQTQKILNVTNKLSSESPQSSEALLPLINEVLMLRQKLNGSSENIGTQESLSAAAEATEKLDKRLADTRESVLSRWSRKVELSSGKSALQSSRLRSLGQSAALQVTTVLSNMDRLEKRTKVDRSNYGLSEEHPFLFDDTDFYRLLLKDLVDRRMADSAGGASGLKWKAAASVSKQKKNVDTKASKGRKLRYHVIEKIQGFDAPRNVYSWSDKQAEDLYAGLLGVNISMDDNEPQKDMADDSEANSKDLLVDENFNLFG